MRNIVFNIAQYSIPVLLALTMMGRISSLVLFGIILVLICFMQRKEAGISFVLIMPQVFGTVFSNIGIGVPGSILALLLAIILLKDELHIIKARPSAIIYTSAIILITIFSLVYGNVSAEGSKKFTDLMITTIISIVTFYPIAMSKGVDMNRISIVYLIAGIQLIAMAYDFYGYTRTFDLLDFESFRFSASYNQRIGLPYIGYHAPGMIGCYSIALYLSSKSDGLKIKDIVLLGTALWLILVSGTRQAMICYFIIIALWIMIKSNKLKIINIIPTILLFCLGYIFLSMLNVESIQEIFDTTSTAEERLNREYDFTFKTIKENLFFGVGFGNFRDPFTGQRYAHNIILEVLSEMGVIGFLLMFIVIIIFFIRNGFSLFKRTASNNLAFIILVPYLIRSMVSDDFSYNIILFIVIFTLYNKTSINKTN